jgi:hypothetical protein
VAQILRSTATARGRWKKIYRSNHVFFIKSPKTRKSAIIFFSFFSTGNQYFPHIPSVASKKFPSATPSA